MRVKSSSTATRGSILTESGNSSTLPSDPRGYADAWELYADQGWSALPVPRGSKRLVLSGYTGKFNEGHQVPTRDDMKTWASKSPKGNLALALPRTVVSVDVDAYHDGLISLELISRKYGNLPRTVWSSARDDGGGQFFFRIKEGTRLVHASKVIDPSLSGVEFVQYHHRYSVVWPSVHPDLGTRYTWRDTRGIPSPADFPFLPDTWVRAFKHKGKESSGKGFDGTVEDWRHDLPTNRMSYLQVADFNKRVRDLQLTPGTRHDTMGTTVDWLVHLGADGKNVNEALDELEMAFIEALDGERNAEREFHSRLEWAIKSFGASDDDTEDNNNKRSRY